MSLAFDDRCPAFRAISVIGDRWIMMILRDLIVEGPRRFQDFNHARTGMSPNVLSDRLKRLEAEGVIAKRLYSEHPPRYEYDLTEKGLALKPVMKALYNWGETFTSASK